MVAAGGAGGNGPMDWGCMWERCCSRDAIGGRVSIAFIGAILHDDTICIMVMYDTVD